MNMEFTIADNTEKDAIFLAYYNYFVVMFGSDYGRNTVRKAILAKDYNSKMAAFLNTAYAKAGDVINNALPNGNIVKMSVGGVTRGFFRIVFVEENGEYIAHIGELAIPPQYAYGDRVDNLGDLIKAIEAEIKVNAPNISRVSYEAINNDATTIVALEENGYYHMPLNSDTRTYTIIFEKNLLEEKVARD